MPKACPYSHVRLIASVSVFVGLAVSASGTPAQADFIGAPSLPTTTPGAGSSPLPTNSAWVQTSLDIAGARVTAADNGVVERFEMYIGAEYAPSTVQFWVMEPVAGGYSPRSATAVHAVAPNSLNVVAANLSIAKGDYVAISEPAGNDIDTPVIAATAVNRYFTSAPTVGSALSGGVDQTGVLPWHAVVLYGSSAPPDDPSTPGNGPTLKLETPQTGRSYRTLRKVTGKTDSDVQKVILSLVRCSGGCPSKSKSSKTKQAKSSCAALIARGKGKLNFKHLSASGCQATKLLASKKLSHTIKVSKGRFSWDLEGKIKGSPKGLKKKGSYELNVEARNSSGSTVKASVFKIG